MFQMNKLRTGGIMIIECLLNLNVIQQNMLSTFKNQSTEIVCAPFIVKEI